METKVTIKITPRLFKLGERLSEGIHAGMLWVAGAVEARAVEEAPRVSGNLIDYIRKYVDKTRAVISSEAPYSVFVHEGTGLYGPLRQRIFPKEKKALAFFYKGKRIAVKSTKGQRPNRYMARGLKKVSPSPQEIINRAVMEFLSKEN